MPDNENELVNFSEAQRGSLSITALKGTFEPRLIRLNATVINASLALNLTVEEARAVIAQLESVIESVTDEVIA
jgi:hypothetical protein